MAKAGDWSTRLGHFGGSSIASTFYCVDLHRVGGSQPECEGRALRSGRWEERPSARLRTGGEWAVVITELPGCPGAAPDTGVGGGIPLGTRREPGSPLRLSTYYRRQHLCKSQECLYDHSRCPSSQSLPGPMSHYIHRPGAPQNLPGERERNKLQNWESIHIRAN